MQLQSKLFEKPKKALTKKELCGQIHADKKGMLRESLKRGNYKNSDYGGSGWIFIPPELP